MVIAVANQKGGSGKTTTASAIATGATHHGKKALAIDLDPQSNLTFIMDGDPSKPGTYEMLTQGANIADLIQHTSQGDVLGASIDLATAEIALKDDARTNALRRAISPIKAFYDVIVIDCPPTLGALLMNALTASDGVIIPMRAKMVNLQGLWLLMQTIDNTKATTNPKINVLGILLTEHNGRTIASRDVSETIRETADKLGVPVFSTAIRQGVAVDEAQIMRESLFEYAPKSNPARDYLEFLQEIGI